METEISGRVRNMELVKIIDWIPKVWHHLNRFLEAHSSSDVTIGVWETGLRGWAGILRCLFSGPWPGQHFAGTVSRSWTVHKDRKGAEGQSQSRQTPDC